MTPEADKVTPECERRRHQYVTLLHLQAGSETGHMVNVERAIKVHNFGVSLRTKNVSTAFEKLHKRQRSSV